MMFKFVDANDSLKVRLREDGNLMFNKKIAEWMGIDSVRHLKVALDVKSPEFKIIYLVLSEEKTDITAPVYKQTPYYYIKLERVLRKLGFKMKKLKFIIEESSEKHEGNRVFILKLK